MDEMSYVWIEKCIRVVGSALHLGEWLVRVFIMSI
jgi:uncharacterized membrane protein